MVTAPPVRIFLSYADADSSLRKELDKHLFLLQQDNLCVIWGHHNVILGEDYSRQIAELIDSAEIILILCSSDYFATPSCYESELQHALSRHRAQVARVLPIRVRACVLPRDLAELQQLPRLGRPILERRYRDAVWTEVASAIRDAAQQLRPPLREPPLREVAEAVSAITAPAVATEAAERANPPIISEEPPAVAIPSNHREPLPAKTIPAQPSADLYFSEFKVTPLYWNILLISFIVGVFQFSLAFAADITGDDISGLTKKFGYITVYHWSFTFITLFPFLMAGSIQVLYDFYSSLFNRRQKIYVISAVVIASLLCIALIQREYFDATNPFYVNKYSDKYCQWNYVICDAPVAAAKHVIRNILRNISYLHYLLMYIAFASAEFSCLALWILHRRIPIPEHLLVQQSAYARYASVLYLAYIVVLRSSKISLMLETKNSAVHLREFWTLFTNLKTYESIAFGNAALFVAIWAFTFFVCLAMNISLLKNTQKSDNDGLVQADFNRKKIFKRYILISSAQLFFVVFPPPNGMHLMALLLIICIFVMAVLEIRNSAE